MKDIYVKINCKVLEDLFPNKDFINLEEIIKKLEDIKIEKEIIEEELQDLKQDINDNFKRIEKKSQYEIYDYDFI